MSELPTVIVGRVYRTPREPSGLFRVLKIFPACNGHAESAFGEFVGDHPKGYSDGAHGSYPAAELAGREEPE